MTFSSVRQNGKFPGVSIHFRTGDLANYRSQGVGPPLQVIGVMDEYQSRPFHCNVQLNKQDLRHTSSSWTTICPTYVFNATAH